MKTQCSTDISNETKLNKKSYLGGQLKPPGECVASHSRHASTPTNTPDSIKHPSVHSAVYLAESPVIVWDFLYLR